MKKKKYKDRGGIKNLIVFNQVPYVPKNINVIKIQITQLNVCNCIKKQDKCNTF